MAFAKYSALIFVSSFTSFVFGATTVGPLAPLSIHKQPSYSSAKPCAAKCLVYQGVWNCGVNAGYHDLGSDLGCGCSPNNACWCGADLQVSATSYISSCVSAGCGTSGNAEGEVKNMLGLYSGYCATANVETSTSKAASVVTTGAAVSTSAATRASNGAEASVTATAARETSTVTAEKEENKEDSGLSKSDIIALGTGLGVGIPSLLVAIIALWIQIRKKRATKAVDTKVEPDANQMQPAYAPSPPPLYATNELSAQNEVLNPGYVEVHELGSRGGRR